MSGKMWNIQMSKEIGFGLGLFFLVMLGIGGYIYTHPQSINGGGSYNYTPPVGCALSVAQNVQTATFNYASGAGTTGATANVYDPVMNLIKSSLALATNYGTNYGEQYTFYSTHTGYFPVIQQWTSPCGQSAAIASIKEAAVDTSTISFVNSDGLTANAHTVGGNQTIGSGGAKTMKMILSGAAAQKFMTDPVCGPQTAGTLSLNGQNTQYGGQFVVVANFTNFTGEIDPVVTTMIGCVPNPGGSSNGITYSGGVPGAVSGQGLAWLCNGNVYNWAQNSWQLTVGAKVGVTPASQTVSISVYPVTGTLSSSATGSKPMSCVVQNDAGTAAGTALTGSLYIN